MGDLWYIAASIANGKEIKIIRTSNIKPKMITKAS